ncbi:pilus assembly protein [Nocardioides limicola]|uniref:pilus assembly protein n=1 Tax=Nocardioides limicola TaxID=2803368 RepID=UPI0027DB890E|nr:pilus assembly protein [Nocardioides sp. DJM-14]
MTRRPQRGAVTAETAMVLPILVAVTVLMVWVVSVTVAQIRAVDAAREVARALARDEPEVDARAVGARVAPAGARIDIAVGDDLVTVTVVAAVSGPGGWLSRTVAPQVRATAVARREGVP